MPQKSIVPPGVMNVLTYPDINLIAFTALMSLQRSAISIKPTLTPEVAVVVTTVTLVEQLVVTAGVQLVCRTHVCESPTIVQTEQAELRNVVMVWIGDASVVEGSDVYAQLLGGRTAAFVD